jgi:hypothetical protein
MRFSYNFKLLLKLKQDDISFDKESPIQEVSLDKMNPLSLNTSIKPQQKENKEVNTIEMVHSPKKKRGGQKPFSLNLMGVASPQDSDSGFKLGGGLVQMDSGDNSDEKEPSIPKIQISDSQNSFVNEILSEMYESVYELPSARDDLRDYLELEMSKFKMDPPNVTTPNLGEIFGFIKRVAFNCKMENEIPIISLAYIEKLLKQKEVLVNEENWRGIVLTTLCIGSKIWDDDSLENEHFPKVMPELTMKQISNLEKTYLGLIDFDVIIRGKEYAQSLFILQSLADSEIMNY